MILLVDDEPDTRTIARLSLQQLGGFAVVEAASGAEALEIAARLQPALVLLDVMMPDMDGTSVLEALRRHPSTRALPVIFLTAKAMPAELSRLRSMGASAILTKPFDPAALPALVRQVLERGSVTDSRPDAGDAGHAPASSPDEIDASAMEDLWGLEGETGADLVGELIDLFAANTPQVIRHMRDQIGTSLFRDTERLAHSLKTSALTLGAGRIAELARTIERAARDRQADVILPLVDQIDTLLEPTIARLRAVRAGLAASR